MRTRLGKIARLPKQIREQLNQRLEDGERGKTIVQWLNGLPETQKLIAEQFAGQPIREQNLSEWRKGGYEDWLRHQNLRQQARWTTEQSMDLDSDVDEGTITLSENIAMVMTAELAIHVQTLAAITDPKERFRQFRLLSRELSRMRRDDQRTLRNKLRREQWESTLEPVADEPKENTEPDPQPETPCAAASSNSADIPACGSSGLSSPESALIQPSMNPQIHPSQPSASNAEPPMREPIAKEISANSCSTYRPANSTPWATQMSRAQEANSCPKSTPHPTTHESTLRASPPDYPTLSHQFPVKKIAL